MIILSQQVMQKKIKKRIEIKIHLDQNNKQKKKV